jgi:hypothetical protein
MMRALALLLLSLSALSAQTFRGNIAGVVQDATGASIAGASVKLESPATGFTRSMLSAATGEFVFAELPVGKFTLVVSQSGFETKRYENLEVAVSKTSNVVITLGVAQQASTVEVSAQAVTLETSSSALVGVVGPKLVADLPMNGRDFRQMLKLTPGVSPASSSVNGMRTSGNNYQIDGADNNDAFHNTSAVNQGGVSGIAGTLLPVEAIDQFSVQTNASAEAGRNGGASVNLVIKSGTNDLHGSAYYFNRNEAFAEPSPLQPAGAKPRVVRSNQYGFSLGGPIIKNRTFFFATGEAQVAIANNAVQGTHPSDAWFADARNTLARYGVPVNQVALNLRSLWPSRFDSTPATLNNFLSTDQNDYDSYNGIIKVDHRFNDNHTIAGRYFGGTGKQAAASGSPYREYFQVAPSRMHNVSIVQSSVFGPRIVNQITAGVNFFLQVFNDSDISANPVALGLNTGVTEPSLSGAPTTTINGFAGVGPTQPLGRIDTTGHIVDNLSLTYGRHQVKVGGEYRRARLDVFYDTNKRGRFVFDGARGPWANDTSLNANQRALADFLAGFTSNANGAQITRGQLQRDYWQNSFDWWAHDNWQVTSQFNLNFGVRYTYHGPLHDAKDSITTFIPDRGFVGPGNGLDTLYRRDLNNLAPRVGFAYTPIKNGKTVLRGSFGFFYDVPPLNFIVANTSAPNGGSAGVHANPGGPSPVFSIALSGVDIVLNQPIFGTAQPRPPFGAYAVDQNFRIPYVMNYNFNVQHQLTGSTLVQAGYVASGGRKLSVLRNINMPTPGVVAGAQLRRPFAAQYPELAAINQLESATNSNYHSFQAMLRQSLKKGLTANVNYTWGHAIDNTSDVRNNMPTNSNDLRNERGSSTFDVRHILTSFVSYDLPAFTKALPLLTKGWTVNALFTAHTGSPLNILAGTNVSGTGESRDRVDLVGDPFSGVVQNPAVRTLRWFNPAAFARPAQGTFGNLGRNAIYGPGFGAVDFSVFKATPITEKITTQLRFEIFNLTNQTNWANPGTSLAATAGFGVITNTRNGGSAPGLGFGEPRNMQIALKIIF